MDHFDDFFPDMAGLLHAVHTSDQLSGPDEHVSDTNLAAPIALAVVQKRSAPLEFR